MGGQSSSRGVEQSPYPGYDPIINDISQFTLYRNLAHRQVGILVPPGKLEISDAALRDVLRDTASESIKGVIVDVSGQVPMTGDSYASRIHKRAEAVGINKVVVIGSVTPDAAKAYDTADTLEEAVNKLLPAKLIN